MDKLKEQNRLTRDFIRGDFYSTLWMSGVAFAALMVLGFVLGLFMEDLAAGFIERFTLQIGDSGIVDSDGRIQLLPLLANNLRASLATIGYGLIPYCFLPALSLGINSMLLGFFAAYYVSNGMSMLQYFAALVPHGIFELPALVISIALGLYLCRTVTDSLRHPQKGAISAALLNILRVFLLRAVPLFVFASLVETFFTPWFAGLF